MINLGEPDKPSPGDVVLRSKYGDTEYLTFWCPGCKSWHSVNSTWSWNYSLCSTTINPSIKVTGFSEKGQTICHSYVRDGRIGYLSDCTHELKGQNVKMVDVIEQLEKKEDHGSATA
jgi:hypothetical protein